MSIESLKRYITNQSELESYIGTVTSFDNLNLIKAERDIDKAVASFRSDDQFGKALPRRTQVYENAVLTTTTATISDLSSTTTGFYSRTVIEILSGSNLGKRIAIQSHSTNTLTFFDTQTGLNETSPVIIYQDAKFPRKIDTYAQGSTYYKTIPDFIKEAVALQYAWRLKNEGDLDNINRQSGYSVSKDSYSENFDSSNTDIENRISPQAFDLLKSNGLTTQSI